MPKIRIESIVNSAFLLSAAFGCERVVLAQTPSIPFPCSTSAAIGCQEWVVDEKTIPNPVVDAGLISDGGYLYALGRPNGKDTLFKLDQNTGHLKASVELSTYSISQAKFFTKSGNFIYVIFENGVYAVKDLVNQENGKDSHYLIISSTKRFDVYSTPFSSPTGISISDTAPDCLLIYNDQAILSLKRSDFTGNVVNSRYGHLKPLLSNTNVYQASGNELWKSTFDSGTCKMDSTGEQNIALVPDDVSANAVSNPIFDTDKKFIYISMERLTSEDPSKNLLGGGIAQVDINPWTSASITRPLSGQGKCSTYGWPPLVDNSTPVLHESTLFVHAKKLGQNDTTPPHTYNLDCTNANMAFDLISSEKKLGSSEKRYTFFNSLNYPSKLITTDPVFLNNDPSRALIGTDQGMLLFMNNGGKWTGSNKTIPYQDATLSVKSTPVISGDNSKAFYYNQQGHIISINLKI